MARNLDSEGSSTDVQALNMPQRPVETPPATDFSLLGVLRLLDARPTRSHREVARELGLSLGKSNYLMKSLLRKGFVKAKNFRNSSNKRAYAYLLTPEGVAAKAQLTRDYLARKIEEYDALRLEIARLQEESDNSVG